MRKGICALLLVTCVLALTACGLWDRKPKSGSGANPEGSATAGAGPAGEGGANGQGLGPAGPGLRVTQSALGTIVTDNRGFPLYRFDKDSAQPAKPTCYGDCAKKWPAFPWSDSLAVEGLDRALVGKVQRTDGTAQVTINGWPAYKYTGDARPGDWTGHGVGGTWWVISPQGAKAAPPSSGGGY